jgi:hypothetical protein
MLLDNDLKRDLIEVQHRLRLRSITDVIHLFLKRALDKELGRKPAKVKEEKNDEQTAETNTVGMHAHSCGAGAGRRLRLLRHHAAVPGVWWATLVILGTLGDVLHFRCEACGADSSLDCSQNEQVN